MKKISYKFGQIIGFGIASLIFFTMLYLILSYTKKINFTLNNYLIILIFPAVLIILNTIYRIIKK